MIEDKNPPKLPPNILVISLEGVSFGTDADGEKSVMIHLHIPENSIGLAPGLGLAFRMSPDESRKFAAVLCKKADEAEAAETRQ